MIDDKKYYLMDCDYALTIRSNEQKSWTLFIENMYASVVKLSRKLFLRVPLAQFVSKQIYRWKRMRKSLNEGKQICRID